MADPVAPCEHVEALRRHRPIVGDVADEEREGGIIEWGSIRSGRDWDPLGYLGSSGGSVRDLVIGGQPSAVRRARSATWARLRIEPTFPAAY